ncbi:MAG: NAD-dependent epimerase/dehydratase family protein [Chloroflexota bacterium]
MPSALITGIRGFVGSHLSAQLLQRGWQVYGFDHRSGDGTNIFTGDIADRAAFRNALDECKPNFLIHLAGLIKSTQPEELYYANVFGTVTLLESLLESGQRPVVIVASSSAVYGSGFGSRPISERFKPRPVTHYAVSKLVQEIAALHYFDAFQLPVLVVRMFNLLGPGQSPDLACSTFARQIAMAEGNGGDEIVTGELNAQRDFVDVRDAVRAFALLAEHGKGGQIYNVCSGHAVLVRKCLDDMLSMSLRQLRVRVDAERVQKNDVPIQVGNAQKLTRATGWHPQIALRRSLSDLLEYWRQRVKSGLE